MLTYIKVIFSFPNLLAYNHLDNLRPTVSYLHDDVGIPTERMGKLVATHPQVSVASALIH
jgi:hypothetical protein